MDKNMKSNLQGLEPRGWKITWKLREKSEPAVEVRFGLLIRNPAGFIGVRFQEAVAWKPVQIPHPPQTLNPKGLQRAWVPTPKNP